MCRGIPAFFGTAAAVASAAASDPDTTDSILQGDLTVTVIDKS